MVEKGRKKRPERTDILFSSFRLEIQKITNRQYTQGLKITKGLKAGQYVYYLSEIPGQ